MVREYPEKIDPAALDAAVAATRLGYGLRPGEVAAIGEDASGYLMRQLGQPDMPAALTGLPDSAEVIREMLQARARGEASLRAWRLEARRIASYEAAQQLTAMLQSRTPFFERLVRFWSDHFMMSMHRPAALPLAAAFEREAIRPNVMGSFYTMMVAVARHPAMLIYLDNVRSIGPRSTVGWDTPGAAARQEMARALIADYTRGPDFRLRDVDVQGLADMLTGWTVGRLGGPNAGRFEFQPDWHEPGMKRFLDAIMPEGGALEGEAAIDRLVRSEETGWHLSRKMARYFFGPGAPEAVTAEIYSGYANGASAGSMAVEIARSPLSLSPEFRAYKSPLDLVLSLHRALGRTDGEAALHDLRALGQEPWQMPDGTAWPDGTLGWAAEGKFLERLAFLEDFAGRARLPDGMDAVDFAFEILGPLLRPETYRMLRVVLSEAEALNLIFASPEFMRR